MILLDQCGGVYKFEIKFYLLRVSYHTIPKMGDKTNKRIGDTILTSIFILI